MGLRYFKSSEYTGNCKNCGDSTPWEIREKYYRFSLCKDCAVKLADKIKEKIGDE